MSLCNLTDTWHVSIIAKGRFYAEKTYWLEKWNVIAN